MTNPATIIARLSNDLRQGPPSDMTTTTANRLIGILTKMLEAMERLEKKRQGILNDRTLTTDGQQRDIGKLATGSISDYQSLERVVDELEKTLANTALFSVKPPITDPILRQLRGQELRDGYRGLNHHERAGLFQQFAEQDRDEELDAMLDAPGTPLVTAEQKRGVLDARARRRQPEAYAQWQQDVLLRDHLNALREHVVLCLLSMGGDVKKITQALGSTPHYFHKEAPKHASKTLGEVLKHVS